MKIEFATLKAMSIVKYFTLMISLQIFREFNFMILLTVFSANWFHEKIFKLCKFVKKETEKKLWNKRNQKFKHQYMLQFGNPFRKSTLQTKYQMLDFLKSIRQSSISLNNVLLFQDLILPLGLEVVLLEFYHNFRIFFTHYDSTHKKQLLLYYWARKL